MALNPSISQPSSNPFDNLLKDLGSKWNDVSGVTAANEFNAEQAALQRQYESNEAFKQRLWEEQMSNTAYQRAVKDMEAAGLNPQSLSGMSAGGSPASTPSGAAPSGSSASSAGLGTGGFVGGVVQGLLRMFGMKMVLSRTTFKNVTK